MKIHNHEYLGHSGWLFLYGNQVAEVDDTVGLNWNIRPPKRGCDRWTGDFWLYANPDSHQIVRSGHILEAILIGPSHPSCCLGPIFAITCQLYCKQATFAGDSRASRLYTYITVGEPEHIQAHTINTLLNQQVLCDR